MIVLCRPRPTSRACIVNIWLIVFRCLPGEVTICGTIERRNAHNGISEIFQMTL